MPMIWDAPLTTAVAGELDVLLKEARLRAHRFDWDARELSLYFRTLTLRWALHPERGWVNSLPPQEPPEDSRPLAASVVGIEAPRDERLIRIRLSRLRGRVRRVQIVLELMTGQWNALLLEGEAETIRHLLWTRRSEARTLTVGHPYRPPEPSTRWGSRESPSRAAWLLRMASLREEGEKKAVLDGLAFASPINVDALLETGEDAHRPDRAGEDPRPEDGTGAPAAVTGFELWGRLQTQDALQPCLLETTRGQQPYPFVLNGFEHLIFPSLLDAFQALASRAQGDTAYLDHLMERVERALHQARGRVRGLERELAQASDPDHPRNLANLLLARLGGVERGASEARVADFHGDPVVIPLDPSKSPQENAEELYREAGRLERAREKLPSLLREAEKKVQGLEQLREELREGSLSPEEAESRVPVGSDGPRIPGRTEDARRPYLRFRSSGGLEIRVGRGSSENDALTFRHARPEDVWLHAREAAGAHVVLRWAKPEAPPGRDLTEAAILAALNSQARTAAVVPVDWTRRKHVRKPRGARPGTVVPRETRTLFVEPDPGLPERLRFEE
jgi:hypothetical protein